jgi:hypothetical protein
MSDTLHDNPPVETKLVKKTSHHWLSPEDWKAAQTIADQLNETEKQAPSDREHREASRT